jgi:hypothetical protein
VENPLSFWYNILAKTKTKRKEISMAIIPQKSMFVWENDINNLGDLKRLTLALENLPDEKLMRTLEKARGKGRDDFPVRAMWNMQIAKIVFGHADDADIIREMKRNVQLRYVCGFENGKVPEAHNVSRFLGLLEKHSSEVLEVFTKLSETLCEILPDFGKCAALDSKWSWSKANRRSKREKPDGRSETDAAWGSKEYKGRREDGSEWIKTEHCFGFKIHLLVCAKHELPIAFSMTDAAASDVKSGKELLEKIDKERSDVLKRCDFFMADRGYDDTALILWLKERGIKSVIDKRDMWRADKEKELPGRKNVYYDEHGEVYCYSEEHGERHRMLPNGYDKERDALRRKCPVKAYGAKCRGKDTCAYCKDIRVPLETDPRIFTQVDRCGYKWKRLYNMRTSVERVNSRIDVSFGFEERTVRGLSKMTLRYALALSVMNAMAVGRIKENRPDLMRSLVRAA